MPAPRPTLPFAIILALACREPTARDAGPDARGMSVSVASNTVRLIRGDSIRLVAVSRNSAGSEIADVTYAWTSRDASVATVSSRGVASADVLAPYLHQDPATSPKYLALLEAAAGAGDNR